MSDTILQDIWNPHKGAKFRKNDDFSKTVYDETLNITL